MVRIAHPVIIRAFLMGIIKNVTAPRTIPLTADAGSVLRTLPTFIANA